MELTGSLLVADVGVRVPLMALLLFQAGLLLAAAGRNDMAFDIGLVAAEATTNGAEPSIRLLVMALLVIDAAIVVCLLVAGSLVVDSCANRASICCDTAELDVDAELAAALVLELEEEEAPPPPLPPKDKLPRAVRCSSCNAATLSSLDFCSSSTLVSISLIIVTSARN